MQSTPIISLSELKKEWTQWRTNGRSRHTPPHLKEQALAQLKTHKISAVVKMLGINTAMLKRWKQEIDCQPDPLTSSFVTLPAISPETAEKKSPILSLKLTHHFSDDSKLSLEGRLSLEHWQTALTLLKPKESK
jgi:hypothetical protein